MTVLNELTTLLVISGVPMFSLFSTLYRVSADEMKKYDEVNTFLTYRISDVLPLLIANSIVLNAVALGGILILCLLRRLLYPGDARSAERFREDFCIGFDLAYVGIYLQFVTAMVCGYHFAALRSGDSHQKFVYYSGMTTFVLINVMFIGLMIMILVVRRRTMQDARQIRYHRPVMYRL